MLYYFRYFLTRRITAISNLPFFFFFLGFRKPTVVIIPKLGTETVWNWDLEPKPPVPESAPNWHFQGWSNSMVLAFLGLGTAIPWVYILGPLSITFKRDWLLNLYLLTDHNSKTHRNMPPEFELCKTGKEKSQAQWCFFVLWYSLNEES